MVRYSFYLCSSDITRTIVNFDSLNRCHVGGYRSIPRCYHNELNKFTSLEDKISGKNEGARVECY